MSKLWNTEAFLYDPKFENCMQAPNYEINKCMILVEEAQHVSYVLHKRDNNNQKYQDNSKLSTNIYQN